MTVKNDADARAFLYRSRFRHDGRGQLVGQTYDYYDSTNKLVKLLSDIETSYDLAGNVVSKTVNNGPSELWDYTYTYDTGYRLRTLSVVCTDTSTPPIRGGYTYTYTITHDLRGNIDSVVIDVTPSTGGPEFTIDLPGAMKYDAHNRMMQFSTGSGVGMKTSKLKYDQLEWFTTDTDRE